MAFGLQAITGGETVTLTNGAPYRVLAARGMMGPAARRVTTQGPAQDGDTDKGYRLQPRDIELVIGYEATSDSVLDGHRDTLLRIFRPRISTLVQLRVTRDDGDVRQIDTFVTGDVAVEMSPALRPGHYQRLRVRLRAPDPTFYDPVPGTASLTGSASFVTDWYLAGGAIGTARVLMHGSVPTQGEAWSYTTQEVFGTAGFTLVLRGEMDAIPASNIQYMFVTREESDVVFNSAFALYVSPNGYGHGYPNYLTFVPPPGTISTMITYRHTFPTDLRLYIVDQTTLTPVQKSHLSNVVVDMNNQAFRYWRARWPGSTTTYWQNEINFYAMYKPALSAGEMAALAPYMEGVGDNPASNLFVPLEGNMRIYPKINIRGPIDDPVVTTVIDGHSYTLALEGYTVGPGSSIVYNLTPGVKTALTAGSADIRGYLSTDTTLETFHLFPDPDTGGNVVSLQGGNMGTATRLQVIYNHRFASF